MDKIDVYSSMDSWKRDMSKIMDPLNLPEDFGGDFDFWPGLYLNLLYSYCRIVSLKYLIYCIQIALYLSVLDTFFAKNKSSLEIELKITQFLTL